MKIIHIFNDDKFSHMAHRVFEEVYPGRNQFIIFTNKKELVYYKNIDAKIYPRYYIFFHYVVKKLISGDVVVFHSLNNDSLKILSFIPDSIKIIWIGWGYDYYDLLPIDLLKEKTRLKFGSYVPSNDSYRQRFKRLAKRILYKGLDKRLLIQKVNIFSPVLYEDYVLVRDAQPNKLLAEYKSWNYGTLEDDLIRGFEGKGVIGSNILFGNSASAANNHLDMLPVLEKLNLEGRNVITPLSYGDAGYREIVIKAGKESLGNSFQPLIDFVQVDEYIAIVQSCSVVVMNHLRQQALGNIIIALYLGAKVFLDVSNPVYLFFKKLNAYIYSIEELEKEYETRLSTIKIEKNREILQNYWGRSVILEKTKAIVQAAVKL